MWWSFRDGAVLLALLGCVGLVLATASRDRLGDAPQVEVTGALGPGAGERVAQPLPLSDEDSARIHAGVIRLPEVPTIELPPPALLSALPAAVPLQALPPAVAQEVPLVRGHNFVKLHDRILIVSAARVVVSEIPRYKLVLQ